MKLILFNNGAIKHLPNSQIADNSLPFNEKALNAVLLINTFIHSVQFLTKKIQY